MRRLADLVLGIPALLVLAPLLLGLMAAVALESRGGAIFRQTRIGRNGVPFTILKLRTMRATLTSDGPSPLGGRHDPRVTRLGQLLRRTHLDELPQLVNVVRGEMTLIGPRPETPEFVALYSPAQRAVLAVRPGITGPGQVEYATRWEPLLDGATDPNDVYVRMIMGPKLDLELAYLADRGLRADLAIVRETIAGLLGATTRR